MSAITLLACVCRRPGVRNNAGLIFVSSWSLWKRTVLKSELTGADVMMSDVVVNTAC